MISRALVLAALVAIAAPPATAQGSTASAAVSQARAAGIVGERYDGYLGVAVDGSPYLRRQVASVNLLRRSLYSQLSRSRGVSMQEIGVTAGCQLLATVRVGERYYSVGNAWRTRGPAQPAPIPDYCR
ncbi:MAG: hypothetical protein NVS3B5_06020 [Sphingomicrobium sp.]